MSTSISAFARLGLYSRAVLFSAFFTVSTFTVGMLIVIIFMFPFKVRYGLGRMWAKLNLRAMKFFCNLDYEVQGLETLPDNSAIIFSKHQSTFECFVILADFPTFAWVLKRELLWIPIFGWALALTKPIAIDRRSGVVAVEQIVAKGEKSLKESRSVVIFPEGTRTSPGTKVKYKVGGALLAERSCYPVYPLAHNSGEFWPKQSFIKWPGKVTFTVGPKIIPQNKDPVEIMQEAKNWIENRVEEISDPARWNR